MSPNVILDNFELICRICLQEKKEMCLISTLNIITMIKACTEVDISVDDQLPQQVCMCCVKRLENAYQLKEECEISDQKLRELIELKIEKIDIKVELITDTIKNENFDNVKQVKNDVNLYSCDTSQNYCETNNSCELSEDYLEGSNDSNQQSQSIHKLDTVESKDVENETKKSFVCEMCGGKFNKAWYLGGHMKRMHKVKGTKCRYCSIICYHPLHLKVHEQLHTNSAFKCDVCHKSFINGQQLGRHKNSHTTVRPFYCLQCNNSFKDQWALRKHVKTIHINPEKRVACEICHKQLLPRHLEQHLLTHQQRQTIKCEKCPKKFYHTYSLKMHIQREHENVGRLRKHLCNICGRSMEFAADLRRHLLTHTGEKPYACDKCDKKYRTTSMLKTHISRVHLNERNYACSVCSRTFFDRVLLTNHERTHTDEKPFGCDICNKGYRTKGKLKEHISRTHLHVQNHVCSICSRRFFERKKMISHMKKKHADQKLTILCDQVNKTAVNVMQN